MGAATLAELRAAREHVAKKYSKTEEGRAEAWKGTQKASKTGESALMEMLKTILHGLRRYTKVTLNPLPP